MVDRHLLRMWELEGAAILGETGVKTEFWHASSGHPLVKESGVKYMRALGEYLRERLPTLVLARL